MTESTIEVLAEELGQLKEWLAESKNALAMIQLITEHYVTTPNGLSLCNPHSDRFLDYSSEEVARAINLVVPENDWYDLKIAFRFRFNDDPLFSEFTEAKKPFLEGLGWKFTDHLSS